MSIDRRDEVAVAFGAVLRAARRDQGLSQEVLSELAKFDRTYPSLLERGLRCPSLACVIAIADALKVKPVNLVAQTLTHLQECRK